MDKLRKLALEEAHKLLMIEWSTLGIEMGDMTKSET